MPPGLELALVTEFLRMRFRRPTSRLSREALRSWKADGRIAIGL